MEFEPASIKKNNRGDLEKQPQRFSEKAMAADLPVLPP
jgi:hypothetical protein